MKYSLLRNSREMFRLMTSLLESFKNLLESGRHLNLRFTVTCSTTFICRASSLFLFLCFSPVLGDTRALCGRFLSSIRCDAQRLRSKISLSSSSSATATSSSTKSLAPQLDRLVRLARVAARVFYPASSAIARTVQWALQ